MSNPMKRILIIALVGLLTSASAASAAPSTLPSQQPVALSLIDSASVPWSQVLQAERAVVEQVNTLRQYWKVPQVYFTSQTTGIPVGLSSGPGVLGAAGVHFADGVVSGMPSIYITSGKAPDFTVTASSGVHLSWTVALSHEVLEMLVDPQLTRHMLGHIMEVCDPVEGYTYRIHGVLVSDFVTPRWFGVGDVRHHERFDYLGRVHHVLQVARTGYMPLLWRLEKHAQRQGDGDEG